MIVPIVIGLGLLWGGYRSKHGGVINPVEPDEIYKVLQNNISSPVTVLMQDPHNPQSPAAPIPLGTNVVTSGKFYSKPLDFGDNVWVEVIVATGQIGQGLKGFIQRNFLSPTPLTKHSGLLAGFAR